jgi:hypothetical protein
MKAFLSGLMCSVLVISQAIARDSHVAPNGGPQYPGTQNVSGIYAGAMSPSNSGNPSGCATNSLGVFSLIVPSIGLATGTFVMFAQGRVFSGTVTAAADPEKARIRGVLDATFDFTVHITCPDPQCPPDPVLGCSVTPTCDITVTASAKGKFDVNITSASTVSLGVGARLNGDVKLNIDQGQVDSNFVPIPTCIMNLNLDGFKQSNSPTATG